MRTRVVVGCVAAAATAAWALPIATSDTATVSQPAPNVVLMMVDDATVEDITHMPKVQRLLVQHGTSFTHNYAPYPLCCPARATVLTGQYAHNHRVLDNKAPNGGATAFDDSETIATYLTDDYRTAIIGKYLNDIDNDAYIPPGWDTWKVVVKGQFHLTRQTMSLNGAPKTFHTYMTGQYGRQARAFIGNTTEPYFAFLSWVAPHAAKPYETPDDVSYSPYVAKRYRNTYTGPPAAFGDPTLNEADVSDKHSSIRELPLLTATEMADINERLAQRRESLRSVDDEIAKIVRKVRRMGELDNTYFILVSDNGWMEGQHRIPVGKSQPYEPSARVPLIIRGPGLPADATYDAVTGLQDITPTILSMTRQWRDQVEAPIDGVSLLGLLQGKVTTDRAQVIETTLERGDGDPVGVAWTMRGVVTNDRWKYLRFPQTGEVEMYDLATDPYEERSVAGRPGYEAQQNRLQQLYRQYRSCDAEECR